MHKQLLCFCVSVAFAFGLMLPVGAYAAQPDEPEAIALDAGSGFEDAGELTDLGDVAGEAKLVTEDLTGEAKLVTEAELGQLGDSEVSNSYVNEDLLGIDSELDEIGFESDDGVEAESAFDEYNDSDEILEENSQETETSGTTSSKLVSDKDDTPSSSSSSSSSSSKRSSRSENSELSNMQMSANTGEDTYPLIMVAIAALALGAVIIRKRARKIMDEN